MSILRYYLLMMFLYLALVGVVCAGLYEPLHRAFMANWGFNSVILGTLIIGIMLNLRRVISLRPEIRWMEIFRTGTSGLSVAESPNLLRPLAKHLEGMHHDRFSLSVLSLRTVLEGIRGRLDESREISRYTVGLLVFLGLLGTFWGLLGTIGAVSTVIASLEVGNSNFALMFERLKSGLQEPLSGMGTAFSSSLFGLGGSLVLGFVDIQANHAQNRFFNELEEWLSGVTQLINTTGEVDKDKPQTHFPSASLMNRLEMLISELNQTNQHLNTLLPNPPKTNLPQDE